MKLQPAEWEREFFVRLRSHLAAERAWRRLTAAGLGDITKPLLYHCCRGSDRYAELARIDKAFDNINKRIGSLKRAFGKACDRLTDSRAGLFQRRMLRAAVKLYRAPWPFSDGAVCFADATRETPWLRNSETIGKHRQSIQWAEAKHLLAILQVGAKKHGVSLSLMELAELWRAATPGGERDPFTLENTLQRFLASPATKNLDATYLNGFAMILREIAKPDRP